ncbi:MAG: endolytic transglycosylase MltG [Clostridia bacterium]|nr:endolytic transglycosylase MltG [Clostridia bacterium]
MDDRNSFKQEQSLPKKEEQAAIEDVTKKDESSKQAASAPSKKERKKEKKKKSEEAPSSLIGCATSVLPEAETLKRQDTDGAATRVSDPISVKRREQAEQVQEEDQKEPPVIRQRTRPNSALYSFAFTVLYLVFVLLVSVLISLFALDVVNDAFAMKKSGVPIDITLSGDFINIDELAEQLHDQHVIKYPTIFKIYARLRHKGDVEFVAGKYTDIPPEAGYDILLAIFSPAAKARGEINITVPEGYTVDDIINLFVSRGLGTKQAFTEVINTYDFDRERYWFLSDVPLLVDPETDPRIYRLEGFLYPDTYRFYDTYYDKEGDTPGTAAAKAVITKMLEQFRNNFKKSYLTKHRAYMAEKYPDAPELSVYELLTLASILEKEGRAEERERISAVFYNRLTNPQHESIEGKLESNATTQYALRHDGYDVSMEFGDFEVNYETPYNSYKYAGLPPTPISTPALDSINAALYPVEQFDFYFFVATNSGYSFFANTLEEHKINIERAKNGEEAEPPYPEDLEEDDYA